MQLRPVVLALASSLFSLAAGQPPEDPRSTTAFDTAATSPSDVSVASGTIQPRPPFGPFPTVFTVSTAPHIAPTTSLTPASAVPDPDPEPHNKTLAAGTIIAAAVAASVAACLVVVSSVLFFCFRFHRACPSTSVIAPPGPDADTARLVRVENELRVLRARVERVEMLLAASPRTGGGGGGGGGVMYVNEKDDSTLAEGADLSLPKYGD
ncbi:hypothetical protein B0H11DRAFT_2215148 [Mycena galericulata]|nr:hypothetical protein B0H11DRAFT_2215148 [Mycena galericulata]